MNNDHNEIMKPSKFKISYIFGGGFTPSYSLSLFRKFTIDQDGKVILELDEDNSLVKPLQYKVDKVKADNLIKYFYDNKFYELPENLSNYMYTDFETSYLEVNSNTFNRKVGGYAATTFNEFINFVKEFRAIVNDDLEEKFDKKVEKKYETRQKKCFII